jgi:hypothetical protein
MDRTQSNRGGRSRGAGYTLAARLRSDAIEDVHDLDRSPFAFRALSGCRTTVIRTKPSRDLTMMATDTVA